MPCRGLSENLEDVNECLDQMNEIIQKYMSTHIFFIGGDWNEDIYLEAQSRRKQNMKDFLLENDLVTTQTHKTYIAPTGATVSTLDYIFYPKTFGENVKTLHALEDLKVNVSDHLPVCCIINFSLDKATSTNIHKQVKPRVQWAKVDTEVYTAAIEESIPSINTDVDNLYGLDTTSGRSTISWMKLR